jgi:hypothetical protein
MAHKRRTALADAAELPRPSWLRRFERWLFRQAPLEVDPPFAAQADDTRTFEPTEEGSGNFGRWTLDSAGLPAYRYEMDQLTDPRVHYPNSENRDRRDHWHAIGNRRVTALASNDGVVQLYSGDRGGVFVNRFAAWDDTRPRFGFVVAFFRWVQALARWLAARLRPALRRGGLPMPFSAQSSRHDTPPRGAAPPDWLEQAEEQTASMPSLRKQDATADHAYGGGFGYVDAGGDPWATAFRYRPDGADTERHFGMGYARSSTRHRDVLVTRQVYAPFGDDPVLLADVRLENLSAQPLRLCYYEYWDVHLEQLRVDWLRTGPFGAASDARRRQFNDLFSAGAVWEDATNALRVRLSPRQPLPPDFRPPAERCDTDWSTLDVFLADLNGEPDGFYTDKAAFFGRGGARLPDAVAAQAAGEHYDRHAEYDALSRCLVIRRDVTLGPAEYADLRFAYGVVRPGDSATPSGADEGDLGFLERYRAGDPFAETQAQWADSLVLFKTGDDPVLHREMAWHSYSLHAATVYNSFHRLHLVPQGSAYLYLHGADGVPRDQALYTLAASYANPPLAREMLRLLMQLQDATSGRLPYSFTGYGAVDDALGLHSTPSDLDLFLLLAAGEYLSATGDLSILSENVPFYPPDAKREGGSTGLDHIRAAAKHLLEGIGSGEHGLLKIGSGDWSDGVVIDAALSDGIGPFGVTYQNSKRNGESVPNTQMALYVLPLVAALVEAHDGELAAYLRAPLAGLQNAVAAQWNPRGWYNRAVLRGADNRPLPLDRLDLEAQPWALISGVAGRTGTQGLLLQRIDTDLDTPSPIGAALRPGGAVWPAVSQLMTWAYARTGKDALAWRSLYRNTYAAHSTVYPDVWFNTWSGPDGINGTGQERPGGTWTSAVTPMTDFPAMNANPHALALLGLLRVCGVEPAPGGDGLLIHPHVPRERFSLDTPLLRLDVSPGRIAGEYRGMVRGSRALYVHVPEGAYHVRILIDGQVLPNWRADNATFMLPLSYEAGQAVRWEVTWAVEG